MADLLKGKHCIVTGGAGSLGLASARLFLAEGAKVTLVDLRQADLDRAKGGLPADRVAVVAADVSDEAQTKAYLAQSVERWGPIDVLFSNAGNQGPIRPTVDYPVETFDAVIAVHVRGAFLACRYGAPQMNDGGSIIITSSVVGVVGAAGSVAYVTAKHAQVGLMRTLAHELGRRNIRVNTLHPGPIDNAFQLKIEQGISALAGIDATEMLNQRTVFGRHVAPEEVARSALYLASDLSSYVTGTTHLVDGGLTC
jgi:NAD(P)-dependent dehydrogenase (short-subunit alcohol dehydrogenase family)